MSNKSYTESHYGYKIKPKKKSWVDELLEKTKQKALEHQNKINFTDSEKAGIGIGVVVVIGIIIYFIFIK